MLILSWLDKKFESLALMLTMSAMTGLIFLQVIMRYIFESSLVWSEELVRWLFIWTIWIGVAYACKTGQHIRITIFADLLSEGSNRRLQQSMKIALIAFFLWIGWLGLQQAASPIVMRQTSVVMYWPLGGGKVSLAWLYATLPFGALLSAWRILQQLWQNTPISSSEF